MATRKFLFMAADGYSAEQAATDDIALGALSVSPGNINLNSTGKVVGVAAATANGDALVYGQSAASLAGLTMTGAIAMGNSKITGLADGTAAQDAVSYSQLQNAVSGLFWKPPVRVLRVKSDADRSGTPPTAGSAGEAWVVNNWGGSYTDGDIVEWDGDSWEVVVAGSGGEPPDGTRVVVIEASAAGSFAGHEEDFAVYNATTDSWAFTDAADGDAVLVIDGYYADSGFTFNGTDWVQFTGAGQINAGAGLSKLGNTLSVNFGDGITENPSDYVGIDLATTPGLQLTGTSPNKKLAVLPDGTKGIAVGSSGVAAKVESDGAITFDSLNGGLQIELEASNPTLQIATNQLGVRYSATLSGLKTITSGLAVSVDGSTILINGSGQLYAAGSDEATRVENSLVAGENVTKGDPVYWGTANDKFGKARADTDAKAYVFGIAKANIAADASGEVVSYGPAAGVLTGATYGTKYYLDSAGGLKADSPPTAGGSRVVMIGWAVNATTLWVQPIDFGKKAA